MLLLLQAGDCFLTTTLDCTADREYLLSRHLKQAEGEVDLSPLSSSEAKNECRYISTSPYTYVRRCLISNRDHFRHTFLYTLSKPDSTPDTPVAAFSLVTRIMNNAMGQSPWEAKSSLANKEIICTLHNSKVHYGFHKSPLFLPILSRKNQSKFSQPISFRFILIISYSQVFHVVSFLQVHPS